MSTNFICIQVS